MSLLLDTHVLLWWLSKHPTLKDDAKQAIALPDQLIFVSAASAWEISIKKTLGKLSAPDDLSDVLQANHFQELAITIEHVQAVGSLAVHHQDPFDRILVAQAICESLTIVTRDSKIALYPVSTLQA